MKLSVRISIVTFVSVAVAAGIFASATVAARESALRREFRRASVGECQMLGLAIASSLSMEAREAEVQQVVDNVANFPERHPDIEIIEVLDTRGRVVAHTDPTEYAAVRRDSNTRKDLARTAPFVRTLDRERIQVVVPIRLAQPLGILRGTFRIGRLEEAASNERRDWIGSAILGALLFSVALFLLLRRTVSHKIEALARQVSRFKTERGLRLEETGAEEVRTLAANFNQMADELAKHTQELELTVEERTRELRAANQKLAELATTDGLTGLHNHRHFQDRFRRDLEIARRSGRKVSVALIDVDHFKAYNDAHGHLAGDEVLRKVANVIRAEARVTDLVARYGGEEFVVSMPDADRDSAHAAAERMRRRLEAEGVVTVSVGVASFPDDAEDAMALLEVADRALYRAKRGGRNRVVEAEAVA